MLYHRSALRMPPQPTSTGATATEDRATSRWSTYVPAVKAVLTAFVVTRLTVFATIALSLRYIRMDQGMPMPQGAPPILAGLLPWDSQHYAHIAQYGYDWLRTAFFPLYPLLTRALSVVFGGNVFWAGVVLSNAALLVALAYLYALTRVTWDAAAARRTVFYVAAVPGAVFFSTLYTESLFLAMVTATLFHARQGQFARAALAGILAAATRNTGVVLALVIAIEAIRQAGIHPHALTRTPANARRGLVAAAVVPAGLLAYMLYLAHAFADPLAFMHVERLWHKSLSVTNLLHLVPGPLTVPTMIDLLMTLAFVPLLVGVIARRDLASSAYVVPTFMLPLMSGFGVIGMTRYTIMLVPCFVLLGHWGERYWLNRVVTLISLPLIMYVSILFSHWSGPV